MNKNDITRLKTSFDSIAQTVPDSTVEFWYAREIMGALGYDRWENFSKVIEKAAEACQGVGAEVDNHFRGVTQMVQIGSGAKREIKPEELPPEEDIKKLDRRVKAAEKKMMMKSAELPKQIEGKKEE